MQMEKQYTEKIVTMENQVMIKAITEMARALSKSSLEKLEEKLAAGKTIDVDTLAPTLTPSTPTRRTTRSVTTR